MSAPLEQVLEGKYQVLTKLAEGGMGAIYRVRHRLLEEERVVKVLRPQHAGRIELRQRFLQEAKVAIKLKHPGIAQLHDFDVGSDDTAYIVMEFIDGVPLDRLLKEHGPLPIELTMEILRQALDALNYLHERGYVHRDVSPDNLMLTRGFSGEAEVKLIDLGIAKHLETQAGLTSTGTFVGKVRYCSPEHFATSDRKVDARSDLYSVGLIAYEVLTGRYPIEGETFAEMAGGHLFKAPLDFSISDPDEQLPAGLRNVVLHALEKKQADRVASASVFAERLEEFASQKDGEVASQLEAALASVPEKPEPVALDDSSIPTLDSVSRPAPAPEVEERSPTTRPAWLIPTAAGSAIVLLAAVVWLIAGLRPDAPTESQGVVSALDESELASTDFANPQLVEVPQSPPPRIDTPPQRTDTPPPLPRDTASDEPNEDSEPRSDEPTEGSFESDLPAKAVSFETSGLVVEVLTSREGGRFWRRRFDTSPALHTESFVAPAMELPPNGALIELAVQLEADGTVLEVSEDPEGEHRAYALALAAAVLNARFDEPLRQGKPSKGWLRLSFEVAEDGS